MKKIILLLPALLMYICCFAFMNTATSTSSGWYVIEITDNGNIPVSTPDDFYFYAYRVNKSGNTKDSVDCNYVNNVIYNWEDAGGKLCFDLQLQSFKDPLDGLNDTIRIVVMQKSTGIICTRNIFYPELTVSNYVELLDGNGINLKDGVVPSTLKITVDPVNLCAGESGTKITAKLEMASAAAVVIWPNGITGSGTNNATGTIDPSKFPITNSPYALSASVKDGAETVTTNFTLTVNPVPTIAPSNGTFCQGNGEKPEFTITATVEGEGLPYTYTWTKPAALTTSTVLSGTVSAAVNIPNLLIINADKLAAGSYDVNLKVISDAGCAAENKKTLTVNALPDVTLAGLDPACAGGANVVATVNGTGTYSYTWSAPTVGTGQTLNYTPLTTGQIPFKVKVSNTGANICSKELEATLTINPKPTVTLNASVNDGCYGAPLVLTATPGGGIETYVYTWTGAGTSGTGKDLHMTLREGSNKYSVRVKDGNNCSSDPSNEVTVVGNRVIATATANPASVSNGGFTTLKCTNEFKGGSTVVNTYAWTDAAKIKTGDASRQQPQTVNLFANETYQVIVTDNKGCKDTATTTVTVTGTALAVVATGKSVCQGTGNFAVTCTPSGGAGDGDSTKYTYQWNPKGALVFINAKVKSPVVDAAMTPPGKYKATVTVSDGPGSVTSDEIDVEIKLKPVLSNYKATPSSGENAVTATLQTDVSPQDAGLAWTPADKIASGWDSNSATTQLLTAPQAFKVTATSNGCIDTAIVNVNVTTTVFTVDAVGSKGCPNAVLTVEVTAGGGIPNYTYEWNPPAGVQLTSLTAKKPSIKNATTLPAGDYSIPVTVRDQGGASKEAVAVVTIYALVDAVAQGNCNNSTNYDGLITVNAGEAPYKIYTDAAGTAEVAGVVWNAAGTVGTIANLTSGTAYTYYIKDKHACNTKPLSLNVDCSCGAQLVMTIGTQKCASSGESIDIVIQASGGNSFTFDLVNVDKGTKVLQVDNETATRWTHPVQYADRGKYRIERFVAVTDLSAPGTCEGNVVVKEVDVQFFPTPRVDAGTNKPVCGVDMVTLKANGDAGLTYSWDKGVVDGVAFTPPMGVVTTYTLTGTDANGCSNTDQVDVSVNPRPTVSAMAAPNVVCKGDVVMLSHNGTADTYTWDNGGKDGVNIPETTTKYTLTGSMAATGCSDTSSVLVIVNLPAEITERPKDRTIAIGKDVTYNVKAIGNELSYAWQWWNPATKVWTAFVDNTATSPKISGSTTESLTLKEVPASWDGRKVKCIVQGGCGIPMEAEAFLHVKECFEIVVDLKMLSGIRPEDTPGAAVDGWYCKGMPIALKAIVGLADPENGIVANPHFTWTIDGLPATKVIESDSSILTWIPESYEDDIVVRVCAYSDGACDQVCSRYLRLKARTPDNVKMKIVTSIDPERSFCPGEAIDFTVATENEGKKSGFHWYRDIFDKGTGRTKNFVMNQKDTWIKVVFMPSEELCLERAVEDSVFLSVKEFVNPTLRIENNIGDTVACQGDDIIFHAVWTNAGEKPSIQWRKDVWDWGTGEYTTATLGSNKDMWLKCTLTPGNDVCYDGKPLVDTMVIKRREGGAVTISADMEGKTQGDELTFISKVENMSGLWGYEWYVNNNLTPWREKDYITDQLQQGDIVECAVSGEVVCQNRVFSNQIVVDYAGGIDRDTMVTIYRGERIKNLDMLKPGDQLGKIIFVIDELPKYGVGTITPNGKFSYTPNSGFTGTDYVKYLIRNKKDNSVIAGGYIYITVEETSKFFVPNLITPNGDGLNDTWKLDFLPDYPNHLITVFDRNGHVVYEARNYQNDWDGTGLTKGGYVGHINLMNGVYTYVIDLGDKDKTVLKSWVEIRANMNRRDYR